MNQTNQPMRNINGFLKVLLFTCFTFLHSFLKAQSKEITFENVSSINLSDFDNFKEGEKYKWTAKNGSTYGIKYESGIKSTWIEFGGEMVKHGTVYIYDKSYDSPRVEYLKEKTNYVYGEKHGLSEIYYHRKGEPYLSESINYEFGLRNGEYKKYDGPNQLSIFGQYKNGKEEGKWIYYYSSSGDIMYEYEYNGFSAIRYSYGTGNEIVKNSKKAKLLSKCNYKYFVKDNEKRGRWKKHGLSIYYKYNGDIEEKYFFEGEESKNNAQIALSDNGSLKQSGNDNQYADNVVVISELHQSYCATTAKEIKEIKSLINSKNEFAILTKRVGDEICVFLKSKKTEDIPWYNVKYYINLYLKFSKEAMKEKYTPEQLNFMRMLNAETKSFSGPRG